ncbi:hypothetical protein E2C01_102200 [Portunus trituberculatus]|uniref:Uncharacterized protein n=1 Tax=Portunus trituberculatus TaxID=210409 RepID=A0A5B7KBX8_PORTR|nr:hypothetical protein [Portunus trituberculatus]
MHSHTPCQHLLYPTTPSRHFIRTGEVYASRPCDVVPAVHHVQEALLVQLQKLMWGIEIVKTVAINPLTSIDPSQCQ